MNESLIPNVRAYASERQLQIAEPLGSGKDGIVLVGRSMADPARVAIKAHRFMELYLREKAVYQRLAGMAVITVVGFNVPQLLAADDALRVIEMTIVKDRLKARPRLS
jgi:hypothetical protein